MSKPELLSFDKAYFTAYTQLSCSRSLGYGVVGQVPYSEIWLYARENDFEVDDLIEIFSIIDARVRKEKTDG